MIDAKDSRKIMKCKYSKDKGKKRKISIFSGLFILLLANLLWFIFRTGTKPSRITYPCQQAALKNISIIIGSLIPIISISTIWLKMKSSAQRRKAIIIGALIIAPLASGIVLHNSTFAAEIGIVIDPVEVSSEFNSDIFIVNGKDVAHIQNLIDLMGDNGLAFYQSSSIFNNNTRVDGLIAKDDVVLIKNNCQWKKRGGTNTDMLRELIIAILAHPDGFTGEIVIADNGQGRGSMDWGKTNSEDKRQSVVDVVADFAPTYKVSCFLWDDIRFNSVDEFSNGDDDDGYFVYDFADPITGIITTYPKFTTEFGSKISFKNGIWNGTAYEDRLKVINAPVLKSHSSYGVTAAMKNYVGLQSLPLCNGHGSMSIGGLATLMVDCGLPTLNILDAIWVNANPNSAFFTGPWCIYNAATRVNILMASQDPIALDYWAAKHVLMQAAKQIGHNNLESIDPSSSNTNGRLIEAFGTWLNHSRDEFLRKGVNVTLDENEINVYAESLVVSVEDVSIIYNFWFWFEIGSGGAIVAIISTVIIIKNRKKKKAK
ncbi:MAG: DUF362 domain-containing protein [Asgard group archaeon]|nr:DUF362 domain-containing protein [Asgard group archaeon]